MAADLFTHLDDRSDDRETIEIQDGGLILYPQIFSNQESEHYLRALTNEIEWKQEQIQLYGKTHNVPRLTAWYGDPGRTYRYSGITVESLPWIEPLQEIKTRIEEQSGNSFNSVLLNQYRDGSDGVSWHSDDEPELDPNAAIGSVTFGQERAFQLRHKQDKSLKESILLSSGSLLIMEPPTQEHWLHQIPKSKKHMDPRINLTFRTIR